VKHNKVILIGAGVLVLAVLLSFVSCNMRAHMLEMGFGKVALGDSPEAVVAAMGRPNGKGQCGQVVGVMYQTPNCVQEFVYTDPFPLPDGYIVLFDGSGHVIHKASYSSP
jgi:hypothetical protein